MGISRPRSTYPVLTATKFTWALVRTSPLGEQNRMDFAKQTIAERKAFRKAIKTMLECRYIVGYLDNIVEGNTRYFIEFEKQKI